MLRRLLNDSPVGMFIANAVRDETGQLIDFRYAAVNYKIADITGLTDVRQLEGRLMSEVLPGSVHPSNSFNRIKEVLERRESVTFETQYTNQLSQNGWYRITITPHDDSVTVIIVDITDIKQTEQQQQAERLVRLLDCLPIAVFVSEAVYDYSKPEQIIDFVIRDVNMLGAQPHGILREQIVGYRASELFPNDRRNGIFERYVAVIHNQQAQTFEFDYVAADGVRRWLDIRLAPFDTSSVVSTTLDITPIKQAQVSLEVMNDELRRSNENLQQFAYVASHDLQEPLRKVQSFGDLLLSQYADQIDADGIDLVQRMQSAANRMSVLIKDLLTYSRLATQQETSEPQSLNKLITTVLDDLDLVIRESSAAVYVEELPTITGDAGQLRQLFQNLIGNALKFRKPNQSPVISITHRRSGPDNLPMHVSLSGKKTGRFYWEICVTDNGIGFDEKYTDRIFQVFQRLHSKSHYAGTGIGLAICQKVAENHGGFIRASSKPGEGATFRVFLPA
ncbi:sensor histidine kinase [Spirosoma montaniterrae]|uniref:histidine kinase n=1 Tax=Spirosoma montaniterrae TaxID=1178516 RepID=A0A1P9WVE4_9BACT|nr:ATP-binding protein [Spirosoma montaniterrae]AQG79300.1 hypothetical protein AWR27_08170 [Spirosoma montaniterrae]